MEPFLNDPDLTLYCDEALKTLEQLQAESVDCIVTSPPYYGLRDYGVEEQLGLERSVDEYVQRLVEIFAEARRVLSKQGTLWLNLAPSYASGDTGSSRSRQSQNVPACGSDDTELEGSRGLGLSCRDLCDECLTDFLSHHVRTTDTPPPPSQGARLPALTDRDSEPTDSVSASPDASPHDAQESTSLQSWRQLRGSCSRCDSRASSLSAVRSSSDDARGFARSSWLNYTSSLKAKDMVPIPWMVAMALQQDGWYLRSEIIWNKTNALPESVTDRPTKGHETILLLSKSSRYFFDQDAVREPAAWERWGDQSVGKYEGTATASGWMQPKSKSELERFRRSGNSQRKHGEDVGAPGGTDSDLGRGIPWEDNGKGRNIRTVWTFPTQPYADAHFATFPEELARRCILAGCPAGGVVLDPFAGSGTTALVARKNGRRSVLIEINPSYCEMIATRLAQQSLLAL